MGKFPGPARRMACAGAMTAIVLCLLPAPVQADTYFVDNASASCSDAGPGTPTSPYCTISAAVAAHFGPGTTILVEPGSYREQVQIPGSGDPGNPFVIQADGPGVVVDGADDFSDPALWVPYSGNVYLAASVTWSPVQMFVDGAVLGPSVAAPGSVPPDSFVYVSGQGLYVNVGGVTPGGHATFVGRRLYGFYATSDSNLTIQGFHVTRAERKGIYLLGASNHDVVRGNQIDFAFRYGIQAEGCLGVLIEQNVANDNHDSGIALTAGASGCTVQDNECGRNLVPGAFHLGNGIYVYGSSNNVFQRNRLYGNADEGLNLTTGSNNNMSIQNRAWNNRDHGFDSFQSTGALHVGDVAWGNLYDGFAVDGNSTGTRIYDCITVDNGLTTNRFDLWVDVGSSPGFESDYNIIWNSTGRPPVRYKTTIYSSVAAYSAASGEDAHSIQADPRFVAPGAGDFRLLADSPAIDSGDSAAPGWPATDAAGNNRFDDPATANTGVGPVPYTDRGALEYYADGILAVGSGPDVAGARVSPNPLRAGALLTFSTRAPGLLDVAIHDVGGRLVRRVAADVQAPAGIHVVRLDGRGDDGRPLPSGVYFYRIRSPGREAVGRFAVVR